MNGISFEMFFVTVTALLGAMWWLEHGLRRKISCLQAHAEITRERLNIIDQDLTDIEKRLGPVR